MSNQPKTCWFFNWIILKFLVFSSPSCSISVSNISSWDWCVIDCTINLTLCILPPMSNKDWTAIYHWIWPITPPFTVVLTTEASRSDVTVQDPPHPHRLRGPSPSLSGQAWHGPRLVERLFNRPALAPCAGHLCYKTPPSLWSGTQLSQPGLARLLWIALLCYLVLPMAADRFSPQPMS